MITLIILATLVALFLFLLVNQFSGNSTTGSTVGGNRSGSSAVGNQPSGTSTGNTVGGNRSGISAVVNRVAPLSNPQPKINPIFKTIGDNFQTFEQLQEAIKEAGLESSNIVIGIDFTKSNTWTGKNTFNNLCLHTLLPDRLNPYQTVINILGRTLSVFDDDNMIPVYGFGDSVTTDKRVFPLQHDPCHGFEEVLSAYSQIVPHIKLSGPTSFAPLIYETIKIVRKTKAYHILIIIADGQVTNEKETIDAIVACSQFPISIILVGVGDGPWETMQDFDDKIPQRQFDNFQFVPFHQTMMKHMGNEILFARDVLMEIPDQFKIIKSLSLLSFT